ncbi:MAG: fibronectin type III domain-containing protein, partial [Planctomycetes bacterium]|nr:fibronectin type III domain-containing protein [Planctomycetota bacterium]
MNDMEAITLFRSSIATLVLAVFAIPSFAQQPDAPPLPETQPANGPAPPSELKAIDLPNDAGDGLLVSWTLSPDDTPDAKPRKVVKYEILRKKQGEQKYQLVEEKPYQSTSFKDTNCELGESYFYQIVAVAPDGSKSAPVTTGEPAKTIMQYFDKSKAWLGVLLVIVCGSVIYYIQVVKSGKELKLRKIAGLEAIDEAVGRATEMGRSCLFIPGIQDINDIQTIAGITILSHVAGVAAEYGAKLEVPTARSLVMTVARQTVEAAYLAAGRHDAYNEDDIYYLTDEQFGFVAGVTGTMV